MTRRAPSKTQRLAFKAQAVDYAPIASLALLPGDEVELDDGRRGVCIGELAGGLAFRLAGDRAFTWPEPTAQARILRSPNRERNASALEGGAEVDPLLGGSR